MEQYDESSPEFIGAMIDKLFDSFANSTAKVKPPSGVVYRRPPELPKKGLSRMEIRKRILEGIEHNEATQEPGVDPFTFSKSSDSSTTKPIYGEDMGNWQVTEGELKSYGKMFLGRVPSKEEFLSSPELQRTYMDSKVAFLQNEGLIPEEILAAHSEGMTNWGNKKKLQQKIKDSNEFRGNYVNDGMQFVNPSATSTLGVEILKKRQQ